MTTPAPELPVFAVVGRMNMGKSSVLATLLEIDDNEIIRISPTPGETTRCQQHSLAFGRRECVRFIDTPGFSRPIEAMRAIQRLHGEGPPGPETLRRFTADKSGDFADEKMLLAPLLAGAGVLYIVDPDKPLRDDFLAEMEILRWTGRPRLALLNRRDDSAGLHEAAWRDRLGTAFNLTRNFNAHRARYRERLGLLESLLQIEESHAKALSATIALVNEEWLRRREDCADAILEWLAECLALRVTENLTEKELAIPGRKERLGGVLEQRYHRKLSQLERRMFEKLLEIHRHNLLAAEASDHAGDLDLSKEETWRKWGLSRNQLTVTAAVAGAMTGGVVDVTTGGMTLGAATAIGAAVGGIGAWFGGSRLPSLKLDISKAIKLEATSERALTVGPPLNPNFPWVLLDNALDRYQRMLLRSHARRDRETLGPGGASFTSGFPAARRNTFAKWFATRAKDRRDQAQDTRVIAELIETLREIEAAG